MSRRRDAEAELHLPPGFRFHPTDEELVRHYLCRKAAGLRPPVPIIADIDLYKFDPWELPEKALFGQREWYFFTTRDRKYPNGSRPNRAAGRGYWKATGADKPVAARESGMVLGIKKALVFYSGKAPRGVKTDWILHEYRLADANRAPVIKGTLRLNDCVICRLYNKKNNWEKMQQQKEETSFGETMDCMDDMGSDQSFKTPESDVMNDAPLLDYHDSGCPSQASVVQALSASGKVDHPMAGNNQRQNDDWFMDLKLEDLESSYSILHAVNQDYCIQSFIPHRQVAQPYQFTVRR